MSLPISTALCELPTETWDAVIIGAGVAGGLAANLLTRNHPGRILVLDAKKFPREKVCGCCLNQRGQAVLERSGLLKSVESLGGIQLNQMQLIVGNQTYGWPTPSMLVTRRSSLDALLVSKSIAEGATFCDGTRATILSESSQAVRSVQLKHADGTTRIVQAALVVVADGLTQSSLAKLDEFTTDIYDTSRIGVHGMFAETINLAWAQPRLIMAVARQGYVGIAPVDGGMVDIAAAIDPQSISKTKRPGQVVFEILSTCGQNPPDALLNYDWMTTPQLTRRSTKCGSHRIILLGDSLGYVEPFTGEGMSWALQTAELSLPVMLKGLTHWSDDIVNQWESILRERVVQKQWICRMLTQMIRSPIRARWAARLCQYAPPIRSWVMNKVSGLG